MTVKKLLLSELEKMNDTTPPKKDVVNEICEGAAESLKAFMGPASPLLNLIYSSFHQKALEQWRNDVHQELTRLGKFQEAFSIENLLNNQEFTVVLLQGMQIAARNFQEEKLNYLRNAILRTPITPPAADLKLSFLRHVDELTAIQIKILSILSSRKFDTESISSYSELLKFLNSECSLNLRRHEFKMYLLGLVNNGLIRLSNNFDDFEGEVYDSQTISFEDGQGQSSKYIVVLETGELFLKFIGG